MRLSTAIWKIIINPEGSAKRAAWKDGQAIVSKGCRIFFLDVPEDINEHVGVSLYEPRMEDYKATDWEVRA